MKIEEIVQQIYKNRNPLDFFLKETIENSFIVKKDNKNILIYENDILIIEIQNNNLFLSYSFLLKCNKKIFRLLLSPNEVEQNFLSSFNRILKNPIEKFVIFFNKLTNDIFVEKIDPKKILK
jgi:hypothetical protein